eukprot:scaffold11694_cov16-Tisochrysis_lutea.AAC.2
MKTAKEQWILSMPHPQASDPSLAACCRMCTLHARIGHLQCVPPNASFPCVRAHKKEVRVSPHRQKRHRHCKGLAPGLRRRGKIPGRGSAMGRSRQASKETANPNATPHDQDLTNTLTAKNWVYLKGLAGSLGIAIL